MTEYTSKQVKINKPDTVIYNTLSDFSNFTHILKDKVDDWSADDTTCSFKAKGFTLKLRIIEKQPCNVIKIAGEDMPFEMLFWIQLHSVDSNDTRMRLTSKLNLNPMMKMMLGKKLEKGINDMADHIAMAFNSL